MSAMDKMIAQMIGVDPAELARMVADFQTGIVRVQEQQNRMEEKLDAILSAIEEGKTHDDGSERNRAGKRSRGAGSGDRRNGAATE